MELLISFEDAQRDFPTEVYMVQKDAAKKLKRSKAKKKGKSIAELTWYISYAEEIDGGHTLEDIFSGKRAQDEAAKEQLPTEAKVADIVRRTHASLNAKMPGASSWAALEKVPQVLVAEIRKRVINDEAEQARVDAMSPEEREAEIQDLLGQLRGPGFMEL